MLKRPNLYYVSDILHQLEYSDRDYEAQKFKVKMPGQLKLLLTEIRFLTEDVEIHTMADREFTILYIGSGKGYHIPFLISLYEKYNIKWIFFDPAGHCDKLYEYQKFSKNKIDIRNEYFLDKNIIEFKNIENLIYISDIRSIDSNKINIPDVSPNTQNLLHDYKIQNNVIKQLKPLFSLVKFRMPFPDDWKEGFEFEKPVGKEYLQAFQKQSSTEFRIFLNSTPVFEKINDIEELKKYEEKFSWYNREYRSQFENDLNIAYYTLQYYYNIEIPSKRIKRKDILKFLITIQKSY